MSIKVESDSHQKVLTALGTVICDSFGTTRTKTIIYDVEPMKSVLRMSIGMDDMRGTWVVQSVGCLDLGFGSAHDPQGLEIESCVGLLAKHGACLKLSLSLSLFPLYHVHMYILPLLKNN